MDWRNSAETSEGRSSEERRLGAERGCWVGWPDSGRNRDEAFCCWSPSQHLRELDASSKACHVGGVAIQARGRAPTLDGGCSLQVRFHTQARSYPTGKDILSPHPPQMAGHHSTTQPEHTEFIGVSIHPVIHHLVNVTIIVHCIFVWEVKCDCLLNVNLHKSLFWRYLQNL